jgi:hypothetical protein
MENLTELKTQQEQLVIDINLAIKKLAEIANSMKQDAQQLDSNDNNRNNR